MTVQIHESVELPITTGKIEVDTTKDSVTIFMKSAPAHISDQSLTITKISKDHNMIALYGESSLVDDNDIIMFGLPVYAKVKKGKVKTLVLKSDGTHWRIIHQE